MNGTSTSYANSATSTDHIRSPWCPLCSNNPTKVETNVNSSGKTTQNEKKDILFQKVNAYLEGTLEGDLAEGGLFTKGSLDEILDQGSTLGGSHRWRKYIKTMNHVDDDFEPNDIKTGVEYETKGEVSTHGENTTQSHFSVQRTVTREVAGKQGVIETAIWDSSDPKHVRRESKFSE
eukprot:GHVP01049271.1.p1 GENE.GHVP01049271.1~~GHVP01049271.1.p1  ORF type:complete len:188 (+),score=35.79 GHVP01049271.1:34-564(+)